jgi:DNA-binding NarL/FixJ family response regulator
MKRRRGRKTRRGQSLQPAARGGTIERPQDSQTKIPTTVHEGGFFSWGFSKRAREEYFGHRVSGRDRQADLEKLTKTQKLVYPMLEDGLTNKEIAGKLGRSEQTAKTHVRDIRRTLKLKSRAALVRS